MISGGTREQLEHQNFRELESWKISGMLSAADDALASGRERDIEVHYASSFGKEHWLACLFTPFIFEGEQFLLVMLNDITALKQVEAALLASEEKFRTMIEQATEGFALIDEEGKIIEWNCANEKIWGCTRETVLGSPFCDAQFERIVPERRTLERYQFLKSTISEALRTGKSPIFERVLEAELYRPDGGRVFIEQRVFPIKTERGYRIGSLSVDVTEMKRSLQARVPGEEEHLASSRPGSEKKTRTRGG
jgi:PAS domain S-box-containing protein